MLTTKIPVTVRVPATAEEWQLYTEMNDSERAAGALKYALLRAMSAAAGDQLRTTTTVPNAGVLYHTFVRPVAENYRHVGAVDSEPRDLAMAILIMWVESLERLGRAMAPYAQVQR